MQAKSAFTMKELKPVIMKDVTPITYFYRIREEGGSGRPPTVQLRTDDVT